MSTHKAFPSPALIKESKSSDAAPISGQAGAGAHTQSTLFIDGMLDMPFARFKRQSPAQMAASVLLHVGLIALLVIVPGYFVRNAIAPPPQEMTLIYAPPAPAPPPPAAARAARAQERKVTTPTPRFTRTQPLEAPRTIPKNDSAASAPTVAQAPDMGVIGGVSGGSADGVLGGILGGTGSGPAAPPQQVLRVGGDVKPPALLKRVEPTYPTIAKLSHLEGTVDIDAVINPQGDVVNEHAVDGPALLIPSALAAVQQWKYQPTYLDGKAVALDMQVSVSFHLNS